MEENIEAIFLEKEIDDPLWSSELIRISNLLTDNLDERIDIVEAVTNDNYSSIAYGIVLDKLGENLCYDYTDLQKFVKRVISDMNYENPSHIYDFHKHKIMIVRNV